MAPALPTARGVRLLRRLGGFGVVPLVSLLTPLVALPVVARHATPPEWAALAIGQAVGVFAALAVSMGWSIVGPARVAQAASRADQRAIFAESSATRMVALLVVGGPACAASWMIAPEDENLLAAIAAASGLPYGLSLTWYAVGIGSPRVLALYEAVPRAVCNLVGAVAVALTGDVLLYPALLLTPVAALVLFWIRETTGLSVRLPWGSMPETLRRQLAPTVTEMVAGAYSLASPALVGLTGSAAVTAEFSSGERVTRLGSVAIATSSNALQGWVAGVGGRSFVRRVQLSAVLHLALGLLGLSVLALAGPELTALLFGESLAIGSSTATAFGVMYLFWSLETVTARHVLGSRGRTTVLLATTAIGSVIGVCAVLVGAGKAGATGAAWGMAGAMTLIVLMQALAAWRVVRAEGRP